ncbi:MAG: serine protease [Methylobacteriaceae bacterium]|nr:serine protease [Methylobacteriaceae bacterium]
MAALNEDWKMPAALQPNPNTYAYDLDRALSSVVGLSSRVPADAFTAEILGTERAGYGALIREDGLVLTIGYLVTEAEDVWLTTNAGRAVPAHVLAYDQVSGFGLIQALGRLNIPVLPIGDPSRAMVGEDVVLAGMGGRTRSVAAQIVARQEFAGYWEYLLDEAIFTSPAHPLWGGAALIGSGGELLGIGSLQLHQATAGGETQPLNMIVPVDLLTPILDDMTRLGRPNRAARPWLGLYASESGNKVVVIGLATDGPASQGGVEAGDTVLAVSGRAVGSLASFFRRVWALGEAGVDVPLTIHRGGRTFELCVTSVDRNQLLKVPRLH